MRRVLTSLVMPLVVLALLATAAPAAMAGRWSTVPLPRHSGLASLTCRFTDWCEAIGGQGKRLAAGHWNGSRWSLSTQLPDPRGASLDAITCRSASSCVAVGDVYSAIWRPITPLVERWNGRGWRREMTPSPKEPRGFRGGVNVRLRSVACPGRRLCFAIGQAVALGSGNAPGIPLIERWDGRRWSVVLDRGGNSPLTSISCASTRACAAVGSLEASTGTSAANNQQVEYPGTVERWDGHRWSPGSFSGPVAPEVGGPSGVDCTSASACLAVGTEVNGSTYGHQAIAAQGTDGAFSSVPLAFPASAYRGDTGNPETRLFAVSCAPTDPAFCAAVGTYNATNGAIGPLAANWNGSAWSQIALRRGPVYLASVSCPALGWCMAVGGGIAEVFR
jgi:hypothetical protein